MCLFKNVDGTLVAREVFVGAPEATEEGQRLGRSARSLIRLPTNYALL